MCYDSAKPGASVHHELARSLLPMYFLCTQGAAPTVIQSGASARPEGHTSRSTKRSGGEALTMYVIQAALWLAREPACAASVDELPHDSLR
eukprot:scaffold1269_cov400-Prasinococcus_capsulatus_cf.AAC.8